MELFEDDSSSSPAVRFGNELRRLRRSRRWSQAELGRRMGYSHGLVSYVERAKKPVTLKFAVAADRVFDTGGVFKELWRRISNASLLEGFAEFVDAEARCRKLRTFHLGVMPGLLQTLDYAAALEAGNVRRGSITQAQADGRVDFLAGRQRILEKDSPPVIHAVLDESCLLRTVGGSEVMRAQLDHLLALAECPNITIQVAPFRLGEQRPFLLPVVLLTLPDRSVVGYAEAHSRGHLERGRESVAGWEEDYDHLKVESLDTAASLAMIRAVRKELQ
ncbi:helix-turn-helix transcriptional regulator [Streptomyces sp. FH025]|uniref:helix-turn-helix domain-containing protein n=1 Tax=Streptomyces sp. FH025 TaxID=2815937 RepID=UPI001A9F23E9|nr:helix-turn-helix transcriptional regulator [Streptomyces sp. FH025]MBO1417353.1 helix-turn-helix transcriptional regulator [Streptomyces sp. FH025]